MWGDYGIEGFGPINVVFYVDTSRVSLRHAQAAEFGVFDMGRGNGI